MLVSILLSQTQGLTVLSFPRSMLTAHCLTAVTFVSTVTGWTTPTLTCQHEYDTFTCCCENPIGSSSGCACPHNMVLQIIALFMISIVHVILGKHTLLSV